MAAIELFKYQEEGIELIVNHYQDVLLADHPGAGKTCQAIIAADRIGAKSILVICPASLRENWKREFQKWGPQFDTYAFYCRKELWNQVDHTFVPTGAPLAKIISYDLAATLPIEDLEDFDLLICDEAHYLKSPKSKRTRHILGKIWPRAKKRICITGTPLPNGRAIEGWSLFSKFAPDLFGGFSGFVRDYCVKQLTPWGINYNKSKNLTILGELARQRFMIRRAREDTIGQLPPLVRLQVPICPPIPPICSDEELQEAIAAADSGFVSGHIATLRRELGNHKAEYCAKYIINLLQEVEHVVVFAHHQEVIAALAGQFLASKITFCTVVGATPSDERQAAIDKFQGGECQVFLGSLLAANTGITLTRAHDVVFVECDWVPSNNEQAEGRCYRIGQTEVTRSHYLVVPDSLDDAVTAAILRKQKDITKVMGV